MRFLGIPTQATLKPYQHASLNFNDTSNPFIEGDNLEVLKRLYNPYFGRIKVIYPHPPYNTGKDFVYPGNYTEPLEPYQDSKANLQTNTPETSGRYHSAWLSISMKTKPKMPLNSISPGNNAVNFCLAIPVGNMSKPMFHRIPPSFNPHYFRNAMSSSGPRRDSESHNASENRHRTDRDTPRYQLFN